MNGTAAVSSHLTRRVQVGRVQMSLDRFRSALTAKAASSMADSLCTSLKRISNNEIFARTDQPVVDAFRVQIVTEGLHLHDNAKVQQAALDTLRFLCVPPQIPSEIREILNNTPGQSFGNEEFGYHVETSIGQRDNNEDTPGLTGIGHKVVGVVCDGMGGHEGGEIASSIAASGILDQTLDLAARFQTLHARVVEKNKSRTSDMGTTAAAFDLDRLTGEGQALALGDSRIYVRRENGSLELLNRPDSLVFAFIEAHKKGKEIAISELYPQLAGPQLAEKTKAILQLLSAEGPFAEAEIELIDELVDNPNLGHKNVLVRCIGMGELPAKLPVRPFQLGPGDTVFAVSDGISLSVAEFKAIFAANAELKAISAEMIKQGTAKGGATADNATFVAVRQPTLTGELPGAAQQQPAAPAAPVAPIAPTEPAEGTAVVNAEQMLRQQVLELQAAKLELETANGTLTQQIAGLKGAAAERDTTIETLQAAVARLSGELDTAKAQLGALSAKPAEQTVVSATPGLIAGLEKAGQQWAEIKAALEQNLGRRQVAEQRKTGAGELVTIYQSLIKLKTGGQTVEAKLAAEKERHEAAMALLQPLRDKLAGFARDKEKNDGKADMLTMLDGLMGPVEKGLKHQEEALRVEHEANIARIRAEFTSTPRNLAGQLDAQKAEISAADGQLAEIEAERQQITARIADVQAELEKLTGEAGAIARQIAALQQEIAEAIVR